MNNARLILKKLIYPPKRVLFTVAPLSFAALIFIFASNKTESVPAYLAYFMSAYSLMILLAAAPSLAAGIKSAVWNSKLMRKLSGTKFGGKYLHDLAFRGSFSMYQGMTVNFFYVVFRVFTGICYHSVWFISMAVYELVLGGLRANLIHAYKKQDKRVEIQSYRHTAQFLFLLNMPMGGMIIQMVMTSAGYSYPGYVIYLSALYAFYTMILSVVNLVKYRKLGSPVLSAAKVLNLVSAMMSILGLQTAMIARFGENDEGFRKMMNTIAGAFVGGIVIIIAVYMLLRSRKMREAAELEQIGE